MAALFLRLLHMSLSASWLVLAVLALRLILRKAPKWTRCILWALVAVRLACPAMIESPVSLVPRMIADGALPGHEWEISIEGLADDYTGTAIIIHDGTGNPETQARYDAAIAAGREPFYDGHPGGYYVITGTDWISEPLTAGVKYARIWLAGLAAMLCYALGSWLRIRRRVREAILLRDKVWLSEGIDAPFILGVFRPRIYLPAGMNEGLIPQVLAHETAHLRRRDHWWKPLGFLLLSVYWFNPLLWLAYLLLCRDIELACDEKVIREFGAEEKKAYAEALLACSLPRFALTACPLAFGEVGVKERVRAVVSYKKPALWVEAAAVAACAVTGVCFLTNPPYPQASAEEFHKTASAEAPEPWDDSWLTPPALTLSGGGDAVKVQAGAYEWAVQTGQGSRDSVHPLLLDPGVELPIFRVDWYGNFSIRPWSSTHRVVKLDFETAPVAVRAYRWSDWYWESGNVRAEEVPVDYSESGGWELAITPGGYVYEVVGQWQAGETGGGTVCYYFYGVSGASERDGADGLPYRNLMSWVSIEPEDYGITGAMLDMTDPPDFSSLSLEALGAYFLHSDGAGAQSAALYLFRWFMERPDSVLIYLNRIQGRPVGNPASGEDTAERLLARAIVFEATDADAYARQLERCRGVYPVGSFAGLLDLLDAGN